MSYETCIIYILILLNVYGYGINYVLCIMIIGCYPRSKRRIKYDASVADRVAVINDGCIHQMT